MEEELLTVEQIAEVKDIFAQFDQDSDGFVTTKEATAAMKTLGQDVSEATLKGMMEKIGISVCGRIHYGEFEALVKYYEKEVGEEEIIKEAFQEFDLNGDGMISREELYKAMKEVEDDITMEQIDAMIKEGDTDKNGKIDYKEFVHLMAGNWYYLEIVITIVIID